MEARSQPMTDRLEDCTWCTVLVLLTVVVWRFAS